MVDYGLSNQQILVIGALSNGASITAAAQEAGVHRNTIINWRRNCLPFQQAFAHAQYDRALYFREKIEDLADLAVQSLQAILTDPNASPSVRLKAALAVINMAVIPPDPKKQVLLEIEKIVTSRKPAETFEAEELPNMNAHEVHNNAQSEVHNSAQPTRPTPRTVQPKPGRNELCPCGSGKKFKRCCIDRPTLAAAA